jgi:hypothetical protein
MPLCFYPTQAEGGKGKKKRGMIRGPLHKATKEIKKAFGATSP